MLTCYIAGPFRSPLPSQRAAHVLTAQAAACDLAAIGYAPYVPHSNLGHALGVVDEPTAARINLTFLRLCDAVLLLPGWQQSVGSKLELREAHRLGVPVFHSLQEARAWRRR